MLKYNPTWRHAGGTGIHREWNVDVAAAGFANPETFGFEVDIDYTPEAWRGGRMRTCNGVGASPPDAIVADFDRALGCLLAERFPQDPPTVPHRVWALVARAPDR